MSVREENDDFLRKIAEVREDDTRRLAYADFLDETAAVRDKAKELRREPEEMRAQAEFIRAQIELEHTTDPARRKELSSTITGLEAVYRPTWQKPLKDALGSEMEFVSFRRGFPDTLVLRVVNRLIERDVLPHSTVSGLTLRDTEGVERIARYPGLARVTSLALESAGGILPGDRCLTDLATSPYLSQLSDLRAINCGIGPEGVRALSVAKGLSLHTLNLSDNVLGQEGAEIIAVSRVFAPLTGLALNNCGVTGIGVEHIARRLRHLETLNLHRNPLGNGGAQALSIPDGPCLRHLGLSNCQIGDAGVQALSTSPLLANLEYLNLQNNTLTDAGVMAIANSATFKNITRLHLDGNSVGAQAAQAVRTSPHLSKEAKVSAFRDGSERFNQRPQKWASRNAVRTFNTHPDLDGADLVGTSSRSSKWDRF